MIRKFSRYFFIAAAILIVNCSDKISPAALDNSQAIKDQDTIYTSEIPDPVNEDEDMVIPEDSLLSFTHYKLYGSGLTKKYWSNETHDNYVYLCAIKLGISSSRSAIMRDAAHMPDVFQSEVDNIYNQQWSHAYIITKTFWGAQWIWGDADDDFHDNIVKSSSSEGYNGKWAGFYYQNGNQSLGDWYTGFACHYIEDVSFVLHSTFPDLDMALHHSDFETWINNNWTSGHNFLAVANAVPVSSYYSISDLKAAIRSASRGSNYSYSSNAKNAWNNYKASGFPTSAGSGSSNTAFYTAKMVEEATKWTGAAIKYSLNTFNQW